ncbi:fibroblast growth factor 19 [Spea bombifrons]|uniref:fibroblast growth factor 19 n=1 Tax=Spea bombifrons TaxID=233779 RepID=UPI00234AC820|nr:fibroblast growth factor 19 [Spea bombifrons]
MRSSLLRSRSLIMLATLWLAHVACTMPLLDAGPHIPQRWGEAIRIRHLYTARRHGQESFYLRINEDGKVDGERHPSSHSLLEIRAVKVGFVAIKGYLSSLYLCMGTDGKLYGTQSYSADDCSFEEELLPDGYNLYKSSKYGIAVSLSKEKQRQQFKGKGYLPLSNFLPMISKVPLEVSNPLDDEDYRFQYNTDDKTAPFIDSMDPLGLVDIPSYRKK